MIIVRSDRTPRRRFGRARPATRAAVLVITAAMVTAACGDAEPAASSEPTQADVGQPALPPTTPNAGAAPETGATPEALEPPSTLATPPPPTSDSDVSTEQPSCRRLTDFDSGDGWVVVNDGVMGGRSVGAAEFADSTLRFTGDVVTAGGGFTSIRMQLFGDELTGSDTLVLRVRADERTYGLTLEDAAQTGRRAISHGSDLTIDGPADADGWQIAELSYRALRPSIFGQPLDAPPFDPDQASEMGIIISDGVDGPFALEVDWIDAC